MLWNGYFFLFFLDIFFNIFENNTRQQYANYRSTITGRHTLAVYFSLIKSFKVIHYLIQCTCFPQSIKHETYKNNIIKETRNFLKQYNQRNTILTKTI